MTHATDGDRPTSDSTHVLLDLLAPSEMPPAVAVGDRSNAVFDVTCALLCLATVFLGMRLISKLWLVNKPTWDDLVVCIAWVFAVGLSTSIMYGSTVGLGKRDVDILHEWVKPLKRSTYAFTVLYNPTLTFTKISILMLYYRMSEARRFFKIATIVIGAIVTVNGIVMTFLNIFQCRPVSAAFELDVPGRCMDIVTLYICSAPVNVITDIAILVLPLPLVTAMRLDIRQKVGLIATFITGVFVTLVDVVRIYFIQGALIQEIDQGQSVLTSKITGEGIPNFSWYVSYTLMWSAVEANVGLICACALVIKPLLVKIFPRKSSTSVQDVNSIDEAIGRSIPVSTRPHEATEGKAPHASSPDSHLGLNIQNLDTIQPIDEDREMGLMEFFSTPEALVVQPPPQTASPSSRLRRLTSGSIMEQLKHWNSPVSTAPVPLQETPTSFMDFVNLGDKKPLTELTRKEAWWPVVFVSLLFWTWGFAYGLLGSLTGQLQALAGFSSVQSLGLHDAYWCGYLIGPIIGYFVLTRVGFKATFITGLTVFTVASLTFWPSSSLLSFPGFIVSNLLIGSGLSILEIAANPFIALAGPEELMEARLNFSQGLQAIGSVLSQLLAVKVLFKHFGVTGLFSSQWVYLAVALWASLLGVIFYYVPLSEASDDDLERVSFRRESRRGMCWRERVWGVRIIWAVSCLGIFVMWMYVGVQEQPSYFWTEIITEISTSITESLAFNLRLVGQSCFTLSRFLASFMCYVGCPGRVVLGISVLGCLICGALSMSLPQGSGTVACFILLNFFEGPIFPTLFAMILRGLGRHTKLVSTGLTAAISGGAVWPSIAWTVQQSNGGNSRQALLVLVIVYAVILVIVVWMNLHPAVRHWLDAERKGTRRDDPHECKEVRVSGSGDLPLRWEKRARGSDGSDGLRAGVEHVEFVDAGKTLESF